MAFKIILFALVAYALYRLFMNDRNKKSDSAKQTRDHLIATGEMVKDPVCGAYVEVGSGVTVRDGDTVTHFCSYECRDKYIKQLQEQGKIDS